VLKLTGEKTKRKAISKALEEWVRRQRIDELRAMAGKVRLDDGWKMWRHTELGQLREFEVEESRRKQARTG
jgi:hypothetical protein